jgi:dienelactone hydrolase
MPCLLLRNTVWTLLIGLGWAAGASAAESQMPVDAAAPAALFQYDPKAPLDIKDLGRTEQNKVIVRDITFNAGDRRVSAFLVSPRGKGRYAGALYVHWLGETLANRRQFLDEAKLLAEKGVVSLLVDALWGQPGWFQNRDIELDLEHSVRQVVELRRAMDVLLAQPGVDAQRIAFVGHDFGAMYGVLLGAVDQRPKTYVLIAGVPRFAPWFLWNAKTPLKDKDAYLKRIAVLDPTRYLPLIKGPSLLFQFGNQDYYVSSTDAVTFYESANAYPRKLMATYSTGHNVAASNFASEDRLSWLERELELRR